MYKRVYGHSFASKNAGVDAAIKAEKQHPTTMDGAKKLVQCDNIQDRSIEEKSETTLLSNIPPPLVHKTFTLPTEDNDDDEWNMQRKNLTDENVKEITDRLKANRNCVTLDLRYNKITDVGMGGGTIPV
ncbi:unnamed protein product [Didymodactylos carnosus]|uniref:Uncharacterized protein n=1 Tax=Didymodactylos carnosus TaxID=1234261 RepID=A0A814P2T0_9BILA|nr:unnamed protein product [Didymodactylos carnosus]CAF1374397.1 unnamed protein product [Didymodactylos carnosus]CAF3866923.1 unnamed protein product [Didymodactylos carnosus]CAF4183335.1 unnamed protein product [Didymodactylos carnosus]